MSNAYKEAGVNVDAGYEAVSRIKKHTERTRRPGVMEGLGAFGAGFDLSELNMKQPILVSGTDGVGTKLMVALATGQHDTIGIDAVAMCVNDIVTQGAEPLFFLDYIACGSLEPERIEQIVKGIADGCEMAGCALVGGETAEMPGMYDEEDYDVAGFAVGAVEKSKRLSGEAIHAGDRLIGLQSNGIHSNGFSLVRRLIQQAGLKYEERFLDTDKTIGQEIMTPTRIYVKPVLEVLKKGVIKGLAHVTGGGFYENIPRMLPGGLGAEITKGSWDIPEVFPFLQKLGNLSEDDLFGTFNMGIGMAVVVAEADVAATLEAFELLGENAFEIGSVTAEAGLVLKETSN
ncbi:phosphoribosylformylglycinamidine cyclo-ligase [Pullulanibacillus sp. KACC 23026]|uniref:phosphoribosylformylglycinamidine cyclo-ligase n=1 Tax=Pullulanibacillus sp. KACC 23026 TaxID=3028315 RepID=UPI0023B15E9D|nr:phosphoribosylformylglycinamidine cyclo-ligase [Pullulanibacillus sp. KACC 23026]WEG12393.1 phosphoribosylformylglycinamidine cyclo-ligase [Pullulanibacillus sp. KACC 23026]